MTKEDTTDANKAKPERVYAMEPMFGTDRDEFVAHIPHCVSLGGKVVEIARERATVRLPWKEELVGYRHFKRPPPLRDRV